MASKKGDGQGSARQHYEYARTGNVPGVGSMGPSKSTSGGQNYKRGGKAKRK